MSIEHIIVVLLENRSYDNVLGYLYGPDNAPPYQTAPTGQADLDGIPIGATNPGPSGPVAAHNQTTMTTAGPTGPAYAPTTIPLFDPGEYFSDMAQQFLGLPFIPTHPPYGASGPQGPSAMRGFVLNYSQIGGIEHPTQNRPAPENIPDVMNYFTPAQLPVTAFLAKHYGVSDEWFASVPTQTYPNRSFALCAAPGVTGGSSLINDSQYFESHLTQPHATLISIAELPSILQQLDTYLGATGATGPFWKVYFHDYSIAIDTVPYVKTAATSPTNINVATFDNTDWSSQQPTQMGPSGRITSTFVEDLQNGLPQFSFIEPRYFDNYAPTMFPPNSNHPGYGPNQVFSSGGTNAPNDAATGEVFLMQLYNMLQANPKWTNMLLLITYDEPGGIWDHVPPPGASSPGGPTAQDGDDPAANGFDYTVFGGRVPTIVVSPWVTAGSTIRSTTSVPFDHASILKTVRDVFLSSTDAQPLNPRDAAAPSLMPGLTGGPVNKTGPFEGEIVCGPRSLYFYWHHLLPDPLAQTILASAGPGYGLTAYGSTGSEQWLSVGATGATALTITVNVDTSVSDNTYVGHVVIQSTGATASNSPVMIPVVFQRSFV